MSLTVKDCLSLPSLSGSYVAAGRGGLSQIVASASVAESFDYSEEDYDVYTPNELVISGFFAIKDDEAMQAEAVQGLKNTGAVALALFYVGSVMKEVPESVLNLADRLDFPIIIMDSGNYSLKYSDVLADLFGAVFKDQEAAKSLNASIRQRLIQLPPHKRTMETLLRMVCSHYKCNLFLTGKSNLYFEAEYRPLAGVSDFETMKALFDDSAEDYDSLEIMTASQPTFAYMKRFNFMGIDGMTLYAACCNTELSREIMLDMCECAELYSTLWNYSLDIQSSRTVLSLILKTDDVVAKKHMQHQGLDIKDYSVPVVISPGGAKAADLMPRLEEIFKEFKKRTIMDEIDGRIVILTNFKDLASDGDLPLAVAIREAVEGSDDAATVFLGDRCANALEIRQQYNLYLKSADTLSKVFTFKRFWDIHDILLCREVTKLQQSSGRRVDYLQRIIDKLEVSEGDNLINTLAVYMIDCNSKLSRTADLMFLHRNTVTYRLDKIKAITGSDFTVMPAFYDFYMAAALWRLQGRG